MVENTISRSNCILCGGDDKKVLFAEENVQAVRCSKCGLVYSFPQDLPPPRLIYDEQYYHSQDPSFGYLDYQGYEHLFRRTFSRRLAEIEKRVGKGRLLDVGCALGFFLEIARESGWDAYGVEVSHYAAECAQRGGLSVFEGTLEDAEFPTDFFHAITIWDLFEGLADPISTLMSVREVLKEGGLLVIGTPDAASVASRLLGRNWAHFKPKENRFYFSPATIRALLAKAGFEAPDISRREGGQYCDLRFLSEKLRPVSFSVSQAVKFMSRSRRLSRLSFYVNTFDRMVVYASKEKTSGEG